MFVVLTYKILQILTSLNATTAMHMQEQNMTTAIKIFMAIKWFVKCMIQDNQIMVMFVLLATQVRHNHISV